MDSSEGSCDPITSNLYDATQEGEVPDTAIKASGEIVLDLGLGGGIYVLLSARRAGSISEPHEFAASKMRGPSCRPGGLRR
jgi:hypothetical protein